VLVEEGQTPLEIVHIKIFDPVLKPETPELYVPGEVTVAPPVTILHEPVPTAGLFARSVPEFEQMV